MLAGRAPAWSVERMPLGREWRGAEEEGGVRARASGCTAMPGMSCASAVQRVSGPGSGCMPAAPTPYLCAPAHCSH